MLRFRLLSSIWKEWKINIDRLLEEENKNRDKLISFYSNHILIREVELHV